MGVPLKALVDATKARLDGVPNAQGWLGGPDTEIPTKAGSDGIVVPHWILYPSPGTPTTELDLGDTVVDADWSIQVTCTTGDPEDLLPLVGRVNDALYRWAPIVAGLVCGVFRPPAGYDPGPLRRDESVKPYRFYLPLQYTLTASTS